MSLLIKKTASRCLLHITQGHNSYEEMLGMPLNNSVIHPDINYTTYKAFDIPLSEMSSSYNNGKYQYRIFVTNGAVSNAFRDYVLYTGSTRRVFVAFIDGAVQNNQAIAPEDSFGGLNTTGSFLFVDGSNTIQPSFNTSTNWMGVSTNSPIGNITLVAFDIGTRGNDLSGGLSFNDSFVRINKNEFSIGGVAIDSIPFICIGELLNHDDYGGFINGGLFIQLVNSTANQAGSFDLNAANGNVIIKAGGKTIVDSTKDLAVSQSKNIISFQRSMTMYKGTYHKLGNLYSGGVYILNVVRTYTNFDGQSVTEDFSGTIISVDINKTARIRVYLSSYTVDIKPNTLEVGIAYPGSYDNDRQYNYSSYEVYLTKIG